MRSPKIPAPTPGANAPQMARGELPSPASGRNPALSMFRPLTSGIFSQRAGRRSLIGGGGS